MRTNKGEIKKHGIDMRGEQPAPVRLQHPDGEEGRFLSGELQPAVCLSRTEGISSRPRAPSPLPLAGEGGERVELAG